MAIHVRRLIVISDPISVDQQRSFIQWLASREMGWSHWLTGGWLLNSLPEQPGATEVRDNFLRIAPNTQVVVFEVQVTDWAGWLATHSLNGAADWLRTQWGLAPVFLPPPQNVLPGHGGS